MKHYVMPQTEAQSITTCQLMGGSPNTMHKNDDPLHGEPGGKIIYA